MSEVDLSAEIQASLLQAVEASFDQQLAALARLVNQPSHTYARDDVEAAAQILDELAVEAGFSVQRHAATDARFADHRVYSTAAAGDGPALALVGHVDTVFPRSSGFLEFAMDGPEVARGPGVVDMKSGLTAILWGCRAVRATLPGEWGEFGARFFCVSDEEVGSPSSRDLYAAFASRVSAALVFEMGRDEDRIVTCRKGGGTFFVEAHGRAAHAGNRHIDGVNAIHALARLIPDIEALTDYDRGVTVNVGLFEGGTAKNTIPEHARCVIDARFVTLADAEEFQERLEAIAAKPLGGSLADAHFSVSGTISRPPMEATEGNRALSVRYGEYAARVGLGRGDAPRQGGFSDSNLLAGHGIATVDGLGPFGGGAHSLDEWCSLPSLKQRTQALALFLADACRRSAGQQES